MSSAKNRPVSKVPTEQYRDNYDAIFGKRDDPKEPEEYSDEERQRLREGIRNHLMMAYLASDDRTLPFHRFSFKFDLLHDNTESVIKRMTEEFVRFLSCFGTTWIRESPQITTRGRNIVDDSFPAVVSFRVALDAEGEPGKTNMVHSGETAKIRSMKCDTNG